MAPRVDVGEQLRHGESLIAVVAPLHPDGSARIERPLMAPLARRRSMGAAQLQAWVLPAAATRTDGVVTGVDAKRSARRDAQHPSSHGSRTRSSRGGSTPHSVPVSVGSAGMPGVESASIRPDGRGLENAAILSALGDSRPLRTIPATRSGGVDLRASMDALAG